jgi:hypothetical protein
MRCEFLPSAPDPIGILDLGGAGGAPCETDLAVGMAATSRFLEGAKALALCFHGGGFRGWVHLDQSAFAIQVAGQHPRSKTSPKSEEIKYIFA